jgi:hypothetical protein
MTPEALDVSHSYSGKTLRQFGGFDSAWIGRGLKYEELLASYKIFV